MEQKHHIREAIYCFKLDKEEKMKEGILYIASNEEGEMLHTHYYAPMSEIKGVIQIVHGMTEYIERYEDFARYFTEQGYAVVGNDIIGHGRSRHSDMSPLYFEKWEDPVRDILSVRNFISERFPGVPVYLLGFSLGSFMCRSLKDRSSYTKEILVGTGCQPSIVLEIIRRMVSFCSHDIDKESEMIKKMAFDNYDMYFKGEEHGAWLLRNDNIREEYWEDSNINSRFSPQFFMEFLKGMEKLNKKENIENIPTLFISGQYDPVGGQGKGLQKVIKKYEKSVSDIKAVEIPGYGHDVLHDSCHDMVYDKILGFLKK